MTAPVDLRAERRNRGKSLAALAAEIGVTKRVLAGAESGSQPHPDNALKIATFFDRTVTEQWPTSDTAAAA